MSSTRYHTLLMRFSGSATGTYTTLEKTTEDCISQLHTVAVNEKQDYDMTTTSSLNHIDLSQFPALYAAHHVKRLWVQLVDDARSPLRGTTCGEISVICFLNCLCACLPACIYLGYDYFAHANEAERLLVKDLADQSLKSCCVAETVVEMKASGPAAAPARSGESKDGNSPAQRENLERAIKKEAEQTVNALSNTLRIKLTTKTREKLAAIRNTVANAHNIDLRRYDSPAHSVTMYGAGGGPGDERERVPLLASSASARAR